MVDKATAVGRVISRVRLTGLTGLTAVAGLAPLPAAAHVARERDLLLQRVLAVRAALRAGPAAQAPAKVTLVAQAANWNNWPKWSKWSNWANQ